MIKFKHLKVNWNKIILIHVFFAFIFYLIWFDFHRADLIIGVVVGFVPSLITFHQNKKDREENHEKWLMQNKEACAIELVEMVIASLNPSENLHMQKESDKITNRLRRVFPALIVWASPSLIKQWLDFTTNQTGDYRPDDARGDAIRRVEKILRTVRRDLGNLHDNELIPGTFWAAVNKSDKKGVEEAHDACKGEKYYTS